MRTLNYKSSTSKIPKYLDGIAEIFEIRQTDGVYPEDYILNTKETIYFEQLSITEKMRYEFESRSNKVIDKIRVAQPNDLNPFNVLKIGDQFLKVFNNYKFTNVDGYKQSDLTLEYCDLEEREDV